MPSDKPLKGKITLEGMQFHAFVGVYEDEKINGNDFLLDLSFVTDIGAARLSDDLSDTIDYTMVYKIVAAEMNRPCALLEHLAARIMEALKNQFTTIRDIELKIKKINPAVGGSVNAVVLTVQDLP
jgi:dihydroneopterin aldolase